MRLRDLAPLPAAFLALLPVALAAQDSGLTLDQVERQYRRMAEVHILKCDKNGDQLFNRGEMGCVRGIYYAMYIED